VKFKTIDQKPNGDEFAKARELIEIRGTGGLSLQDRRVMNVLYANSGAKICDDTSHVIGIAELRGAHKGGERVKDSILRLMKTVVEVPTKDSKGAPATKLVQILSDTTVSDDDNNPAGQVVYSFSRGMREIIKDSKLITARINLKHVWQEEFSVEDFRALLGVPGGKLERIPNLLQRVIQPAALEVNGLADFGVQIEPIRKGGQQRGLVTGFRVAWWRKDIPDLQAAHHELKRVKTGRLARLRGKVDSVGPFDQNGPSSSKNAQIMATAEAMRLGGAFEADIEEFIAGQARSI
jgi:Initiator Replication protein